MGVPTSCVGFFGGCCFFHRFSWACGAQHGDEHLLTGLSFFQLLHILTHFLKSDTVDLRFYEFSDHPPKSSKSDL